jgi:hypothetical protein
MAYIQIKKYQNATIGYEEFHDIPRKTDTKRTRDGRHGLKPSLVVVRLVFGPKRDVIGTRRRVLEHDFGQPAVQFGSAHSARPLRLRLGRSCEPKIEPRRDFEHRTSQQHSFSSTFSFVVKIVQLDRIS